MPWREVVEYAGHATTIETGEYRMQLAIATNPHLKAEAQRKLWRALETERAQSPERIAVEVEKAMKKKAVKRGV